MDPNKQLPLSENLRPEKIRTIHLIGICGTGMGSLAAMLQEAGYKVRGSDENVYPPMSTFLASRNIPVMEGYRPQNLEPPPDLVVVGNVVRRDNPEAAAAIKGGLAYCSMPQVLWSFFLNSRRSVVVAGTHGKTTTAAFLVWLFNEAQLDPGCLVGGLMVNFQQSYRLGQGPYFVVEGDEYDTAFFDKGPKFLHYRPRFCLLTSVEFDHADIYPDLQAVENAFQRLLDSIPADGLLVVNADDPVASRLSLKARCRVITYGLNAPAHFWVEGVDYKVGQTLFRMQGPEEFKVEFTSPLPGAHNLSNTLAVVVMARELGIDPSTVQHALSSFKGVRRRQEVLGEIGGITIVDDFAHHPTAVQSTIQALRHFYGGRRLWAIFEPRTNSSKRNIFHQRYVTAFDAADLVLIKEPPGLERIVPEERLSAGQLVADIRSRSLDAHYFPDVDTMLSFILSRVRREDVLLIMSNGSFDGLIDKLLEGLRNR
ncbi:MAG: UDP-N-acetylmuramate:L-alanyl-gamma-D-glutamyl-meso-diaminopimelate ligase [Deltaproteobacteria bacterium]|nr:MAG: UDP-N-acetylmuramate:L-alanyl-gamma-D-glutamyl-meso-diaminopimelate ligase [Deltaproteobacteria bacterium]